MKNTSIKITAIALLAFLCATASSFAAVNITVDVDTSNYTAFDLTINGKLDYNPTPGSEIWTVQFADLAGGTEANKHNTSWLDYGGNTTYTVMSGTIQNSSGADRTSSISISDDPTYNLGHTFSIIVNNQWDLTNFTFNNLVVRVTNVRLLKLPELDAIWGSGTPNPAGLGVYLDGATITVPEPETYALIFAGIAFGFVMLRRRFKA